MKELKEAILQALRLEGKLPFATIEQRYPSADAQQLHRAYQAAMFQIEVEELEPAPNPEDFEVLHSDTLENGEFDFEAQNAARIELFERQTKDLCALSDAYKALKEKSAEIDRTLDAIETILHRVKVRAWLGRPQDDFIYIDPADRRRGGVPDDWRTEFYATSPTKPTHHSDNE